MENIKKIQVPNLGPNDEYAIITEYLKINGQYVSEDEEIISIETTKMNVELQADTNGYIYFLSEIGDEVKVGTTIAVISSLENLDITTLDLFEENKDISNRSYNEEEVILTHKAEKLIEKYGIKKETLPVGKIIKACDIEKMLPSKTDFYEIPTNSNPMAIIIYGGGGHAKMCIDILKQTNVYKIVGIVDDLQEVGVKILDIPVIGDTSILNELISKGYRLIVNGIGSVLNNTVRYDIYKNLKQKGFLLPNIIHPKASIEPSAILGEGNQIMSNSVIGSDVRLGNNNIINCGAIVSHDCRLDNNVHITPNATLAGGVVIKDNSVIGMGVTVFMKAEIGENVVIHNGCNIVQNVNDNSIIKGS